MQNRVRASVWALSCVLGLVACTAEIAEIGPDPDAGHGSADGGSEASSSDGGAPSEGGDPSRCTLVEATSPTSKVSASGCAVLTRDTSACAADRKAAGLSGFWLDVTCRVKLSKVTSNGVDVVRAQADGLPDTKSNYFPVTDPCHEDYTGAIQNPNWIAKQSFLIDFPLAPNTAMSDQRPTGAVVGLAIDGVVIFGDFAAPGDDIFSEAKTFDRCGAHPQMTGVYHHHTEPLSISNDDGSFIGVLRDGYPVYGRRDPDGSMPTLDGMGGHTGVTRHSPSTPVYHYHANLQTSSDPRSAGQTQWFLTTGYYRGHPSTCVGCN